MTIDPKLTQRIALVIHSMGLSCLGAAIFLQILVFSDIFSQGYFRAVEANATILTLEITLTAFTAIYLYTYQKVIRTALKN